MSTKLTILIKILLYVVLFSAFTFGEVDKDEKSRLLQQRADERRQLQENPKDTTSSSKLRKNTPAPPNQKEEEADSLFYDELGRLKPLILHFDTSSASLPSAVRNMDAVYGREVDYPGSRTLLYHHISAGGYPGLRTFTKSTEGWQHRSSNTIGGVRYENVLQFDASTLSINGENGQILNIPESELIDTPLVSMQWEKGGLGENRFRLDFKRRMTDSFQLELLSESYNIDSSGFFRYQNVTHQPWLGMMKRDSTRIPFDGRNLRTDVYHISPRLSYHHSWFQIFSHVSWYKSANDDAFQSEIIRDSNAYFAAEFSDELYEPEENDFLKGFKLVLFPGTPWQITSATDWIDREQSASNISPYELSRDTLSYYLYDTLETGVLDTLLADSLHLEQLAAETSTRTQITRGNLSLGKQWNNFIPRAVLEYEFLQAREFYGYIYDGSTLPAQHKSILEQDRQSGWLQLTPGNSFIQTRLQAGMQRNSSAFSEIEWSEAASAQFHLDLDDLLWGSPQKMPVKYGRIPAVQSQTDSDSAFTKIQNAKATPDTSLNDTSLIDTSFIDTTFIDTTFIDTTFIDTAFADSPLSDSVANLSQLNRDSLEVFAPYRPKLEISGWARSHYRYPDLHETHFVNPARLYFANPSLSREHIKQMNLQVEGGIGSATLKSFYQGEFIDNPVVPSWVFNSADTLTDLEAFSKRNARALESHILGLKAEFYLGNWNFSMARDIALYQKVQDYNGAVTTPSHLYQRMYHGQIRWRKALVEKKLGLSMKWDWEWFGHRYTFVRSKENRTAYRDKLPHNLVLDFEARMHISSFQLYSRIRNLNHQIMTPEAGYTPPGVNFQYGITWTLRD
jgi:hypothetical protein